MKRFTKTVLLLALLVTVTLLAGCPKDPEIPPEKHPTFIWVDNPYKPQFEEVHTGQNMNFYSANGEGLTRFHYDENDPDLSLGSGNTLTASSSLLTQLETDEDLNIVGFEATMKKVSGDPDYMYGITFFNKDGYYYDLRFHDTSYSLFRYTGGSSCPFLSSCTWTDAPEIVKPEGQENKVKVVTNDDETVSIFINDALIETLTAENGPYLGFIQARTGFSDRNLHATCEFEYSVSKIQKKVF